MFGAFGMEFMNTGLWIATNDVGSKTRQEESWESDGTSTREGVRRFISGGFRGTWTPCFFEVRYWCPSHLSG